MSCEGALKRETEGSVDQDEVSFCARLFFIQKSIYHEIQFPSFRYFKLPFFLSLALTYSDTPTPLGQRCTVVTNLGGLF